METQGWSPAPDGIKYLDKMKIDLGIGVAQEIFANISPVIQDLSNEMNNYFEGKYYGPDLLTLKIRFILALPKQGYENWYKEKKPKFTDFKENVSKFTGEIYQVKKEFSYEVKLSEEILKQILNITASNKKKLLSEELLKSLQNLKNLPRKVKNFNEKNFINDMESFNKE